jgi:predicted acyl esterase
LIDSRHIPPCPPGRQVDILFRQPVLAPGGVHLAAMVFKPRGQAEPLPAIVEMTPYGVDRLYADGVRFANEGFVFVAVDCRGTGDSEGVLAPVVNEAGDYTAVFDWLQAQPWCDGQVATYGGSYSGMNQWLALATGHPALRTIVPSVAPLPPGLASGGIPAHFHLKWAALGGSHGTHGAWGADAGYWNRLLEDLAAGAPASRGADGSAFGHAMPWLLRFQQYPSQGAFWDAFLPSPEVLAHTRVPVLSINGQHDLFIVSALAYHRRFMQWAHPDACRDSHLVIGPWSHAGSADAHPQVGNLRFAEASRFDVQGLVLAWYRWVMQGGDKPAALGHPVLWYACGEEAWHGCDRLEDITAGPLVQALAGTAGPNDVFHSGWLAQDASENGPNLFRCDPHDDDLLAIEHLERADAVMGADAAAVGSRPPNNLYFALAGEEPTSQAYATHLRGQGLVYHSAPLDEPLALAGSPVLDLRCAVDQPDADLAMLLYEIRADGQVIFLSSDLLRLRCRHGADDPTPVTPGEPMTVRFGAARFFARTLARHSRLRLVVRHAMGLDFQRNGHSGKPVHEETLADRRVAEVTVFHHGPERSRVMLPLAAIHPTVDMKV